MISVLNKESYMAKKQAFTLQSTIEKRIADFQVEINQFVKVQMEAIKSEVEVLLQQLDLVAGVDGITDYLAQMKVTGTPPAAESEPGFDCVFEKTLQQ